MSSPGLQVAIVGCGFTGAAAAVALLDRLPGPFGLTLVEPEGRLGRGLAYGRADACHLLNVRAANLGIRAGTAGDFAQWAAARDGLDAAGTDIANAFLPRALFGDYAETRLAEAIASRPDVRVLHRRSEAARLERHGPVQRLHLRDGGELGADVVLLAHGYGRPAPQGRFGASPFFPVDPQALAGARTALFIGTGLTFIDQWLRLRRNGFAGTAHALSRRGLLPAPHSGSLQAWRNPLRTDMPLSRRIAVVRQAIHEHGLHGIAPGDLIAAARDDAQRLWQALDADEQRRFLRHLRPYWDRLRHRLPPAPHAELMRARACGDVRIHAGRALARAGSSCRPVARSGEDLTSADVVFDCSGHRPAVATPLVETLVRSGRASMDAHGLGLAVTEDGGMLDSTGRRAPGLFALGPLGQGSLYEITAVKEIVAQCGRAADSVAATLRLEGAPGAH